MTLKRKKSKLNLRKEKIFSSQILEAFIKIKLSNLLLCSFFVTVGVVIARVSDDLWDVTLLFRHFGGHVNKLVKSNHSKCFVCCYVQLMVFGLFVYCCFFL